MTRREARTRGRAMRRAAAPSAEPVRTSPSISVADEGTSRDPITSWLVILDRMLPGREGERRDILDELESHLRDRVRDLMLSGHEESHAIRVAIAEAGAAGDVAQGYRTEYHRRTRRLTMNLGLIGVAGAALAMSVVAVMRGPESTPAPVFQPAVRLDAGNDRITLEFKNTLLGDALQTLAGGAGFEPMIHWPALADELELTAKSEINVRIIDQPLSEALAMVCEYGGGVGRGLDYRVRGSIMEFAPRRTFDRREVYLATYDLTPAVVAMQDSPILGHKDPVNRILDLIQSFVSREDWEENGGDLARQYVIGGRMFVEAPPRMHEQVKWMLEQLTASVVVPGAKANVAQDADIVRMYPLRHMAAADVLDTLRRLEGIRTIDFTKFALDPATNTVIARASERDHLQFSAALAVLDREVPR